MIVVITDEAEADLEQISDYIATDNPQRAVGFIKELIERCERLTEMPQGFPFVPRFEHTGIRRRPYGNYLIFYCVEETEIQIVRILNGARDYEQILFPDP